MTLCRNSHGEATDVSTVAEYKALKSVASAQTAGAPREGGKPSYRLPGFVIRVISENWSFFKVILEHTSITVLANSL